MVAIANGAVSLGDGVGGDPGRLARITTPFIVGGESTVHPVTYGGRKTHGVIPIRGRTQVRYVWGRPALPSGRGPGPSRTRPSPGAFRHAPRRARPPPAAEPPPGPT